MATSSWRPPVTRRMLAALSFEYDIPDIAGAPNAVAAPPSLTVDGATVRLRGATADDLRKMYFDHYIGRKFHRLEEDQFVEEDGWGRWSNSDRDCTQKTIQDFRKLFAQLTTTDTKFPGNTDDAPIIVQLDQQSIPDHPGGCWCCQETTTKHRYIAFTYTQDTALSTSSSPSPLTPSGRVVGIVMYVTHTSDFGNCVRWSEAQIDRQISLVEILEACGAIVYLLADIFGWDKLIQSIPKRSSMTIPER